jgi:hypothetical protein
MACTAAAAISAKPRHECQNWWRSADGKSVHWLGRQAGIPSSRDGSSQARSCYASCQTRQCSGGCAPRCQATGSCRSGGCPPGAAGCQLSRAAAASWRQLSGCSGPALVPSGRPWGRECHACCAASAAQYALACARGCTSTNVHAPYKLTPCAPVSPPSVNH